MASEQKTHTPNNPEYYRSLVINHFTSPLVGKNGEQLDHHQKDLPFVTKKFDNPETFYLASFVAGALDAYDKNITIGSFITPDGMVESDKQKLSTQRFFAEELGLLVGDFRIDTHNAHLGVADIAPAPAEVLPPAPVLENGIWRSATGEVLDQDDVDRWFSADYLSKLPPEFRQSGYSLGRYFSDHARYAIAANEVSVPVKTDDDPRGILSLTRRMMRLAGCEINAYTKNQTDSKIIYTSPVLSIDPKLGFALYHR